MKITQTFLPLFLFLASQGIVLSQASTDALSTLAPNIPIFQVWPATKMPGIGATLPETAVKSGVLRVTNVSDPTLTVFLAPAAKGPTPALVVCPGGGYSHLSIEAEGTKVAEWLNTIGVSAVVLKYRVPNNKAGALQDLERAVRIVRANQKTWNIDTARVGVLGFSAGGNLCARLLAESAVSYPRIDETDDQSCRPDFVTLIYPAYMGAKGQVSADVAIHGPIPPLFICQADDDKGYMPGTKIYDAALTAAKIPHEFVEYANGGHGFGLGRNAAAAWPERYHAWLTQNKFLPPGA